MAVKTRYDNDLIVGVGGGAVKEEKVVLPLPHPFPERKQKFEMCIMPVQSRKLKIAVRWCEFCDFSSVQSEIELTFNLVSFRLLKIAVIWNFDQILMYHLCILSLYDDLDGKRQTRYSCWAIQSKTNGGWVSKNIHYGFTQFLLFECDVPFFSNQEVYWYVALQLSHLKHL